MAQRSQGIRPSQFVTTYGPGALLEGVTGPRVICSFEKSNLFVDLAVREFEIVEPVLKQILGEEARIFRIPTNADLCKPDRDAIYETEVFPRWSLCVRHGMLYRYSYPNLKTCPGCPAHANKSAAYQAARLEAISLVMACPEGHLQDIDWKRLIHRDTACAGNVFLWEGSGRSLRYVELSCPECRSRTNLGEHYLKDHHCLGLSPETGAVQSCTAKARICQRGAANLFSPEVLSSITIPRQQHPLGRYLEHDALVNLLPLLTDEDGSFDAGLLKRKLPSIKNLPEEIRRALAVAEEAELKQAAHQVQSEAASLTPEQARNLEFQELKTAAQNGCRHQSATSALWSAPEFEVDPALRRDLQFGPFHLQVTPILRLRVVSVQRGYRRLGGTLVETHYSKFNSRWYPGVELLGEGIFVTFARPPATPTGPGWQWWRQLQEATGFSHHRPGFVWWHTLAHRLIRAVAVHSGYSSASVRERIYCPPVPGEGWDGGLLLYAVQPGGDGTLGGLIALAQRFEEVLRVARQFLDNCSNDPFCCDAARQQQAVPELASGPSCFACTLLSETSCEHRNASLDRVLLLDSLENE